MDMTKDEIGKKVMETSQGMASGYVRSISQFQTDAENEANRKCAVAASNTGWFILKSLGFSTEEIEALAAPYRMPELSRCVSE